MVKLLVVLISVLALSACATCSPTERSRRDRAKAIALAYLAQHHMKLAPDAKIRISVGTYYPEMEPSYHFYGVDVSVAIQKRKRLTEIRYDPHDRQRELIYEIWVDPRDWTVEFFCDILRIRP